MLSAGQTYTLSLLLGVKELGEDVKRMDYVKMKEELGYSNASSLDYYDKSLISTLSNLGVDTKQISDFFNNGNLEVVSRVVNNLRETSLVSLLSPDDKLDTILEDGYHKQEKNRGGSGHYEIVVRGGKKVRKFVYDKPKKLTQKQKEALRKAQLKAHTSVANMHRNKSLRLR